MFESAEPGRKIDKATYDAEVPRLREARLEAQVDLAKLAKFPVIMLIGGSASARICLLYTSPSPRDGLLSRMPSSA